MRIAQNEINHRWSWYNMYRAFVEFYYLNHQIREGFVHIFFAHFLVNVIELSSLFQLWLLCANSLLSITTFSVCLVITTSFIWLSQHFRRLRPSLNSSSCNFLPYYGVNRSQIQTFVTERLKHIISKYLRHRKILGHIVVKTVGKSIYSVYCVGLHVSENTRNCSLNTPLWYRVMCQVVTNLTEEYAASVFRI